MSDRKSILSKSIKCVVAAVEALFAESAITEFQTLASTSRLEDSDQTKKPRELWHDGHFNRNWSFGLLRLHHFASVRLTSFRLCLGLGSWLYLLPWKRRCGKPVRKCSWHNSHSYHHLMY